MGDGRLPLTTSLEAEIRTAFASVEPRDGLSGEALITALSELSVSSNESLGEALERATGRRVAADSAALLDWVDATFRVWQDHYPTASDMADELQAGRPLAAAFACTDSRFLTPGAHALQSLLDTLQTGFAGWAPDLGNSARATLDAVKEVMQRCHQDFPSEAAVDHTLGLLQQKITAHTQQLERLDAGVIERESVAIADVLARESVGRYLASTIGNQPLPIKLAEFFGADWFKAGISILEGTGARSDMWETYRATTEALLAHFANVDAQQSGAKNGSADHLPARVRNVLEQVGSSAERSQNSAATIEFLMLRRASEQQSGSLGAVTLDSKPISEWLIDSAVDWEAAGISPGAWYHIDQPDGARRLRLVGAVGDSEHLVFMDFAGGRALRLNAKEFANLLRSHEARLLDTRQTFSRAMVEAAEARMEAVSRDKARQAERAQQQAQRDDDEANRLASERQDASQRLREAERRALDQRAAPATMHNSESGGVPSTEQPFDRNTVLQLQIPIGTWLGFHDREPPIMAKAAVRDLDKDSYIFTNRDGIKLRELTVPQLVTLIERDMVDILERKTSFRDTLASPSARDRIEQFPLNPL